MAQRNPSAFISFLNRQLTAKVPIPTTSFAFQTVIITGSNTGLGFEAAVQIVRLDVSRLILAVRNMKKGDEAKELIEEKTARKGVVEVWELDMARYESVRAFVRKAEALERLDCLIENAGLFDETWGELEDNEAMLTVNVVSTFLLALLVLPKLYQTAAIYKTKPQLAIVSSLVHHYTTLEAKSEPEIFVSMNDKTKAKMRTRYMDSKLLQLLYGRELHKALTSSSSPVSLTFIDPGYCHSGLFGESPALGIRLSRPIMRSTEKGGSTLVLAIQPSHKPDNVAIDMAAENGGLNYMTDGKYALVSKFIRSVEGKATGKRVWRELNEKLTEIQPGILQNV